MLLRLAIKTLLSDRGKLIAAVIGVTLSVVLANIQGGLFLGLVRKAATLVHRGQADIWVGYRGMHNVDFPHDIPKRWLQRIRGIEEVAQADPLTIRFSEMALPDGSFESVVVVGVEPGDSRMARFWHGTMVNDGRSVGEVDQEDAIIVDECDDLKLRNPQVGELREIGGMKARIVGKSHGIQSFLVAPYIFTTNERAIRYTAGDPEKCSYFLVRVKPGVDVHSVCNEINRRLPYAQACTSDEYAAISVNFWMTRTGLGISFGAATVLGLLVGLAMVGQILYAMVLDRISEFATLKALGAREWEIGLILAGQASGVALVGISCGLGITWVIYRYYDSPIATIEIPLILVGVTACGVYLMCLMASSLPYLRVRSVDAHTVLQG